MYSGDESRGHEEARLMGAVVGVCDPAGFLREHAVGGRGCRFGGGVERDDLVNRARGVEDVHRRRVDVYDFAADGDFMHSVRGLVVARCEDRSSRRGAPGRQTRRWMRDPFSPALPFPYLADPFVARIASIKKFHLRSARTQEFQQWKGSIEPWETRARKPKGLATLLKAEVIGQDQDSWGKGSNGILGNIPSRRSTHTCGGGHKCEYFDDEPSLTGYERIDGDEIFARELIQNETDSGSPAAKAASCSTLQEWPLLLPLPPSSPPLESPTVITTVPSPSPPVPPKRRLSVDRSDIINYSAGKSLNATSGGLGRPAAKRCIAKISQTGFTPRGS
ncbi:hypothetical protein C8R44DRAFT_747679 [Mycena epipterygia]|nr:hypothetical protein C8R44DRAFT_747679 [Mycena epipterygia]